MQWLDSTAAQVLVQREVKGRKQIERSEHQNQFVWVFLGKGFHFSKSQFSTFYYKVI